MMSFPKSCVVAALGVLLERAGQHLGVEDVDAHRRQREIGRAGNAGRLLRLFLKAGDPLVLVDGHDAESIRIGDGHFDGGERDGRVAFLVEPQHARVVHLVDVIAREHDQVPRALPQDRVEVLVHGVGGALVPLAR